MSTENTINGDVKAALDFAAKSAAPTVITVKHPDGREEQAVVLRDVDGDAQIHLASEIMAGSPMAPLRRKGTITAHDLGSFITAVNRDKRPDSVIFADIPARKVAAVLDFHGKADSAPRFGDDRIAYGFQFSPQLIAWCEAARSPMSQKEFSRLIDDRLGDIGDPGSVVSGSIAGEFAKRRGILFATIADLVVFTRAIAAKSATDSSEVYDESTGSVAIQYTKKNDVKTADGTPVAVPPAFLLQIPILNGIGATEFSIAVRLRFDIEEKAGIRWRIELHALDKYLQAAIEEALDKVRKAEADGGCGLPVYLAAIP